MKDFGRRPIAHRLLLAAEEAEETFPISLHYCGDCGLVQVLEPIDPELLYKGFNYNFSSWKLEPHQSAELDTIMRRGSYRSVFEIGCNDGRFLNELRLRGIESAVGVEPNPVPAADARARGLTVLETWITPDVCREAVRLNSGTFDLVVSRQVIEHIPDLDNFFRCIDIVLSDNGWLFLDMPDFERCLETADCSTVWEEHVNYFTRPVLVGLLQRHGFAIVDLDWYDFSSGSLAVMAHRATKGAVKKPEAGTAARNVIGLARSYSRRLDAYASALKQRLTDARAKGCEIVLYGAGVRGCCSVNGIMLGDHIDFVVDDQAERQRKFMPGSRLPILSSSILSEKDNPIVCLLAVNNENEEKVMARAASLARRPIFFLTLCSPRDISAAVADFKPAR